MVKTKQGFFKCILYLGQFIHDVKLVYYFVPGPTRCCVLWVDGDADAGVDVAAGGGAGPGVLGRSSQVVAGLSALNES